MENIQGMDIIKSQKRTVDIVNKTNTNDLQTELIKKIHLMI